MTWQLPSICEEDGFKFYPILIIQLPTHPHMNWYEYSKVEEKNVL